MNPIQITPQMVRAAGVADSSGFERLCVFDHFGKGLVVGPADWNGGGLLPCAPALTIPDAIRNWEKQLRKPP